MRLPFYISFFSFLGTLVLAAPVRSSNALPLLLNFVANPFWDLQVGSASNLVNRDDTGKVCMDPVNFGLTDVGLVSCQ